ncbi:MarR family winged helix-turn-helix transcriptional regulator [uncultured Sphingomonas sp.]|uniref:MarR family winged helix-turn-helix transcriptional regulator n=1 Tax=uncultured Sphingomonas sp. TaxID=158754 RepID=UPI0035CBD923
MTETLALLISDVSRLMRKRFNERARLAGATREQWRTLKMLSRNQGMNQGALADLLEVEPITLCRMIDRLEESGLVERRRDPADRRAWQLFLTDRSRPMLDDLHVIGEHLFEQALAGLDEAERARLGASLTQVRDNLSTMVQLEVSEAANG